MSTLLRSTDSPRVAPVSNGPGRFGRTPERARDLAAEHKLERVAQRSTEPAQPFEEHAAHQAQVRAEVQDQVQFRAQLQAGVERMRQAERVTEQRSIERNRALQAQEHAALYSRQGKVASPALPAGSLLHASA